MFNGKVWLNLKWLTVKVDSLYTKDRHNTVRPKVDLLADKVDGYEVAVRNVLIELEKRIEELERYKKL